MTATRRIAAALAFVVLGAVAVSFAQFDTFFETTRLLLGDGDCEYSTGSGSPEGVVTGDVCDIFNRTDGGAATTFYIKESGSGNTGWIAVGGAAVTGTGTANQMARFQSASVIEDASMTDAEVVTGTTTDTFTNKTYDAEGTGNVLTVPEKWYLDMGICDGPSTTLSNWSVPTGAAGADFACNVGTNTVFMSIDFVDSGTRSAQRVIHLPTDFTGSIDVDITWFSTSTTGSVVWQVATICVADAELPDPAFNTASTVTDAAQGVSTQFNEATIVGLTITGCAAGEMLFVQMLRDPADASDDLGAVANLVGFELTVRRAI